MSPVVFKPKRLPSLGRKSPTTTSSSLPALEEQYPTINHWAAEYGSYLADHILPFETRYANGELIYDVVCEVLTYIPEGELIGNRLVSASFWIAVHEVLSTPEDLVRAVLKAGHEATVRTLSTTPFVGFDASHNTTPVAMRIQSDGTVDTSLHPHQWLEDTNDNDATSPTNDKIDAPHTTDDICPWLIKHHVSMDSNDSVDHHRTFGRLDAEVRAAIHTNSYSVLLPTEMAVSIAACGATSCSVTIDDTELGSVRYNKYTAPRIPSKVFCRPRGLCHRGTFCCRLVQVWAWRSWRSAFPSATVDIVAKMCLVALNIL